MIKISHKRVPFLTKRGVTLVASVILIVFASITVLSITTFIVQRFPQTQAQKRITRALYLAQAGIHNALYNFRFHDLTANGYFSLGQTTIDADNSFVVGGTQADLLMVDTSQSFLGGALTPGQCNAIGKACDDTCQQQRDDCRAQCDADRDACRAQADADHNACEAACPPGGHGSPCKQACHAAWTAAREQCDITRDACRADCDAVWQTCKDNCSAEKNDCIDGTKLIDIYLQNATNSQTITIDRMIVTWANSLNLVEIRINGTLVWTGSLPSPANADLNPNFTLNTVPTYYLMDYLRFSGNMQGVATSIQFVMSDGSTTANIPVYPASNNFNFIVKATGKTTGSGIYRTIAAQYNAITGRVIDYDQINTEITP